MARKPVILRFLGDTKHLSKAFYKAGGEAQTFGAKVSKVGLGVAAGVGAMAAGAALGLTKLGGDFQAAYANIRTTTGKTGDELKSLENSFKNVLGQTPAGMGDVSGAIATINQQLGLTGKPLESFALDMIRLGRLTKTDVKDNLKSVTSVLNNWAIPAGKASDTTNLLFRASQKSGVGVGQLADQLAASGTQFRALGLSVTDSAALLGLLGKQGLSAADVMPALSKSLAKSAKEGKPAADAFKQSFSAIALAPDATKAAQIAVDNFGTRAGPKLAGMIREGKLSWQDFSDSITEGDTLSQAAKDTATWKGKLALLKNQVAVTLEPLATRVFSGITDAMSKVMPYLKKFGDWFNENKDTLKPYAIALGIVAGVLVVVAAATAAWNAVLAINPITLIIVAIGALVAGIIYAYQHFDGFRNVLDTIGRWFRDTLWPLFKKIGGWIAKNFPTWRDIIVNVFQQAWDHLKPIWNGIVQYVRGAMDAIQGIIKVVMGIIHGDWSEIWDGIKQYLGGVWEAIKGIVSAGLGYLSAIWNAFASVGGFAWDWLSDGLVSVWNFILRTIGSGVNLAIDVLNGLIDAANLIPGVDISHIKHVSWGQVSGGAASATPTAARGGGVRAMATGGIVTRPTVALIGEAGPEAVIPLRKMNSGGNVYHLTVNALDPRSAATAVVDALKSYERTRGPVPIRTRTA
jgi:hypothetical protein